MSDIRKKIKGNIINVKKREKRKKMKYSTCKKRGSEKNLKVDRVNVKKTESIRKIETTEDPTP